MGEPGFLECPSPCGNSCVKSRDIAAVMKGDRVACLSACKYLYGGIGELAGTVERCNNHSSCPISNWRTVKEPERFSNHRGSHHGFQRDLLLVLCNRVT